MSIPAEGQSTTVGSKPQYEFGPEQNVLIADLASKMRFVGLFGLAIGVLALLRGISPFDLAAILMGVIYLLVALWTRSAGGSFREVVTTEGADVTHLMNALESLRKLYSMTFWLCLAAIALLVVLLTAEVAGGPADVAPPEAVERA